MRFVLAAALTLFAAPAFADAVTYQGDLAGIPIVLELSDPAEGASAELVGRYFYEMLGIDIPLRATESGPGTLTLAEESPCDPETCNGDESAPRPPAALWTLSVSTDGSALTGIWHAEGKQPLPVQLARIGSRPFTPYDPASPADLAEFSLTLSGGEGPLTAETSPYDFLKVQGPVTHSGTTRWGKVAFDDVTDPRTLFAYPRIVDLNGGDIGPANAFLEQDDWSMRLDALNCRAQIYPSMASGGYVSADAGTLGGFDEETISIAYLSETLLSFTKGGSLWCGGAYPDNHFHAYNIDTATGRPIDLSRLFKGWVARNYATDELIDLETARQDPTNYHWGADDALAAFVVAKRPSLFDAEFDAECGYPDVVRTNLTIRFARPDRVIFGLDSLPHAIGVCAEDLYEAPIGTLKALLLPEANTYFPGVLD